MQELKGLLFCLKKSMSSLSYWTGYLYLCKELQRRTEAFSAICVLDDMSLLEEPNGKCLQYL